MKTSKTLILSIVILSGWVLFSTDEAFSHQESEYIEVEENIRLTCGYD